MKALLAFLIGGICVAFAQPTNSTEAEIRGIVVESGLATPIAGVAVAISEFLPNEDNFIVPTVVATAYTDTNGVFAFHPGHIGRFMLSVNREGYRGQERSIALTDEAPRADVRMALIRPASLSGQVVDPEGNPIEGLTVALLPTSQLANPSSPKDYLASVVGIHVLTDSDGRFLASVSPDSYVLALGPKELSDTEPFLPYSDAAFEVVDQDIEPSFWPGGLPDPDQVIPVNLPGGSSANLGVITADFTSYYRVHIVSDHECEPNELWNSRLVRGDQDFSKVRYTDCNQDFLLTGIPPGDYKFSVWVGRDIKRWAIAEFTVTDRNTETTLHFSEPVQISGRLRATGGSTLADLGSAQVLLRSVDGPSPDALGKPNEDGTITFHNVPWKSQSISIETEHPETYVKQVLYNGKPLTSDRLDAYAGAELTIDLAMPAASLSVVAMDDEQPVRARVMLVPEKGSEPPASLGNVPPFSFMGAARPGQPATLVSLPPGNYRVIVTPAYDLEFGDPQVVAERYARGEKIKLEAGEMRSIEVDVQ